MSRKQLLLAGLVVGAGALAFLLTRITSRFEPPERQGPPALVARGDETALWMLVKQEEKRQINRGGSGRYSSARYVLESFYHFQLREHDPATTRPVWQRPLLTLHEKEGGHGAQARILGQDGDVVWLYLHDQPLAVSVRDGTVLADRALLEARNPALKGLIPTDLRFLTHLNGLVITAADARHYRVHATDYLAQPYTPPDAEGFRQANFMSTTWNGGYRTTDFIVRQGRIGGRWIGLYSEAEAADAGNDEFGDKLRDPARVLDEGPLARRALWTARIGKTRAFSEGRHDRLADLQRLPETTDYLQGGFLIRAGSREPLAMTQPEGVLILHRTRLDEQGRLAFARLGSDFSTIWHTVLPVQELTNRWELGDRLLLYGSAPYTRSGVSRRYEYLISLDLGSGRMQAWNLTAERVESPEGAS